MPALKLEMQPHTLPAGHSPMPSINNIFQGVTTSPARDFIATLASRGRYDAFYFPCAGRFTAIDCALAKGVPAAKLFASDITLFSSVIGYLADPRKKLAELGIVLKGRCEEFAADANDDLGFAAATMLAIRYLTIDTKSLYCLNLRREIWHGRSGYLKHIRERLEELQKRLQGIHYDLGDVREVAHQAASAANSFLYVNLPGYKGGYGKMFGPIDEGIDWNKPTITEFNPKEAKVLLEGLTGSSCTALAYVPHGLDQKPEGWHVLLANAGQKDRIDYIVSNQPAKDRHAELKIPDQQARRFEIYDDQEISADTVVRFLRVDQATALYYRDLFVHRLGSTQSHIYFLLTLDGRVTTSMGLDDSLLMLGKSDYLFETFGITKTSKRYSRLGKLFMLLLTSADMRRFVVKEMRSFHLKDIRGVQTTSITQHEEGKTDRSVMKIASRERLSDGQFRIVYRADFRNDTWQDCIMTWLKRWGSKTRV
jgi:hypothetical protein